MAISTNDYFLKVGNPGTATTLSAPGYTVGNSTINVVTTGNFPADTAVIFGIDTATTSTGAQVRTPNSYCVFVGIVTSPTSIGSVTLLSGTPQNYTASALTRVYITVSSVHMNRLISGILNFANPDSTLKTSAVQAALGIGNASNTGFTPFGATMTYTGNNGNKEYTANIAADVTGFLPVGAKIAVTRSTTPPTQCMSFTAASSQYATKASPTGISFTSTFTDEQYIYPNSYPTTYGYLLNKEGSTNGFGLRLLASGQLELFYGSGSSFTNFITNQSIPLKKWTHVAAVLTSASSKTALIYINGYPVTTTSTLTAATALTQSTGDLRIGASANTLTNSYFDGSIIEARIWSTAKTQAEIQANMNIPLTGAETGLVFLAQGNGNFNDKTSNANHLTASGGAIATQASNPMNAIEYFKVTKIGAYSGGVTPLTLFGGTDCNLPNMTLTGAQYSNVDKPFGFPAARGKWAIQATFTGSSNSLSTNWVQATGKQFTVPTGEWKVGYMIDLLANSGGSSHSDYVNATLSQSVNTQDDTLLTSFVQWYNTGLSGGSVTRQNYKSHSSTQTYYLNVKVGSSIQVISGTGEDVLFAELAY